MDTTTLKVGAGGAAVVGVAFGMVRYAYGLTLPDVRATFGLSEQLLGLLASGAFAGYLLGLLAAPRLASRRGARAPTTVGGVCGALGCLTVSLATTPGVLAAGVVLGGTAAGWVWAPYSDLAVDLVPQRDRPLVLAVITTGTGVGLVALGALGLLAAGTSWRVVWAGTAAAAAVAAAANLLAVPRVPARRSDAGRPQRPLARRALARPLLFAVVYFASCTVYFTYAADTAREGGLSAAAVAIVYGLAGVGGTAGLVTGRLSLRVGPSRTAAAGIAVVGGSLALLTLGRESLPLVLLSAPVFGAGYMVGSAVLAIWTAQVAEDRPGDAFTAALVVGAVSSIAAPAGMGLLIPAVGLPTALLLVAGLTVVGATVVPTRGGRPSRATGADHPARS